MSPYYSAQFNSSIFLLAALQLEHILRNVTTRRREQSLLSLPTTLEDVYTDAMNRIERLGGERTEVALKTLTWILYAERPLRMSELHHAVAVQASDRDLDDEHLMDTMDIIHFCQSLVVQDPTGIVHFAHYTVRGFIAERIQDFCFSEIDLGMACLVLRYIR
jgi:hypothetical protein